MDQLKSKGTNTHQKYKIYLNEQKKLIIIPAMVYKVKKINLTLILYHKMDSQMFFKNRLKTYNCKNYSLYKNTKKKMIFLK